MSLPSLFKIVRHSDGGATNPVVTPERALAPTPEELRATAFMLPSNNFEGQNLRPVYKVETLDLNVAQADTDPRIVELTGNIIHFQTSTNASDTIFVRLGSKENDRIPLKPGLGINGMYFERLFLDWAQVAAASAYIIIATDPRIAERVRV